MCNAKIPLVITTLDVLQICCQQDGRLMIKEFYASGTKHLKEQLVGIVCRVDIIEQDAPHFISI
jgi:hypothetical protein